MPAKKTAKEGKHILHSTREALDRLDDHMKHRKKPSYGKFLAGSILALSAAASAHKLRNPKTRKSAQAKLDKLSEKLRSDVKEIQQRFVHEHPEVMKELHELRQGIEKRVSEGVKDAKKSAKVTKKKATKVAKTAHKEAKKSVKKAVKHAKKKVVKKTPAKKKASPKKKTVKKAMKKAPAKKKVAKKVVKKKASAKRKK